MIEVLREELQAARQRDMDALLKALAAARDSSAPAVSEYAQVQALHTQIVEQVTIWHGELRSRVGAYRQGAPAPRFLSTTR